MKTLVIAASLLATLCLARQVKAQEHGHAGDVVRHHVHYSRLRLFAEGDLDLDTAHLQDDESVAMQAWVQAVGPLWFGVGLSGVGSIGRMADSHHPNMGVMVDLSAMLDLREIETQFRVYLEHEWGEHELTLLRFDWRATTHSIASPIVRIVLDHVPEGWDQSHPHSASRWSVTPSAGVMLNLMRQHGHPVLGIAILLGWHLPSVHDTSWTQFHPGLIFEYRVR